MNVLVVGSGGREHALCVALKKSPTVGELLCAPGNGGTALVAENVDIPDHDIHRLVNLALTRKIDLVVVGPEVPLTLGLTDALWAVGVPCFGPDGYAAQLEGSKAFAKNLMVETGVPTADFEVVTDFEAAKAAILRRGAPLVVKADGLAAGKGVVVAKTTDEAIEAARGMLVDGIFGDAGRTVLLEDALVGEEVSFLALCDGTSYVPMPSCQDHKAVGEGDTGPNTGGMGAYSPAPILPESAYAETAKLVIEPIVRALAAKGHPFKGVLYAGLMMTAKGPMVLEYNTRFGDPECQPLMTRFTGDLALALSSAAAGRLDVAQVSFCPQQAMCVVMAANGYPGSYEKGMSIKGLDKAELDPNVKVYVAGAKMVEGELLSSGGRVLGVTALGEDLAAAKQAAYKAVSAIDFPKSFYRRDIGDKGINRLKKTS